MLSTEANEAFERYMLIVKMLTEAQDEKGLSLVRGLTSKCAEYFKIIVEQVSLKEKRKKFPSKTGFLKDFNQLEELRNTLHIYLLQEIRVVNKYLATKSLLEKSQIPERGIYSLDPKTIGKRQFVGEWAFCLAEALFAHHLLENE